jgi:hypothetical protein
VFRRSSKALCTRHERRSNIAAQGALGAKRRKAPRSLPWRALSTTACAAQMRLLDRQTVRRAARGLPALLVAVLRQLALTTQWFPCDGRQERRLRNSRTGIALSISSDPARACRWIHLSSSHSPRRQPRPWRPPQGDSSNWAGRPRSTRRLRWPACARRAVTARSGPCDARPLLYFSLSPSMAYSRANGRKRPSASGIHTLDRLPSRGREAH